MPSPKPADVIKASPWSGRPQGGRRGLGLGDLQKEAVLNLPAHLGLFLNWPLSIAVLCFQSVLASAQQGVFSDYGRRRKPEAMMELFSQRFFLLGFSLC